MVGIGYHVPRVLPGDHRPTKNRLGRNTLDGHGAGLTSTPTPEAKGQRHLGQLCHGYQGGIPK